MTARLDQIRFQMEEARREGAEREQRAEERAKSERRRFIIQTVVTSLAGIAALMTLFLHLTGRL